MRKIIFRGKKTFDGSWVYGDLVTNRYIGSGMDKPGTLVIETRDAIKFTCHEVIAETVGQYTETEDRNEKEIYDGDIILSKQKNKYVVYWETNILESPAWRVETTTATKQAIELHNAEPWQRSKRYLNQISPNKKQVIGNIYDNPELIKGDK